MTASPNYCVLDGDPGNSIAPRNPTVDDLGGENFEDDVEYPPEPEQQVVASNIVQVNQVLSRLAPMLPKSVIWALRTDSSYALLGVTTACSGLTGGSIDISSDGTYGLIVRIPIGVIPSTAIPFDVTFIQLEISDSGSSVLRDITTALAQWVDSNYAYFGIRFFSAGTPAHYTISAKLTIYGEGTMS